MKEIKKEFINIMINNDLDCAEMMDHIFYFIKDICEENGINKKVIVDDLEYILFDEHLRDYL